MPPRQTGIANGLAVFLQVLGSCFGFLYYFLVDDLDALYALYLVVVVCFGSVTLVVAGGGVTRSQPRSPGLTERKPLRSSPSGAYGGDADRNPFLGEPGKGGDDLDAAGPDSAEVVDPFSWADVRECYYVSPYDPATRDFFFVPRRRLPSFLPSFLPCSVGRNGSPRAALVGSTSERRPSE